MDSFFNSIAQQLSNELPFVVYRKPNEALVKGVLQHDDELHTISDYSESGFVFAPFDSNENSIIIPFKDVISVDYIKENLVTKNVYKSSETNTVLDVDKRNHITLVQNGIAAINDNHFQKVVLSRVEEAEFIENNPIQLFKKCLSLYENAFVYLWYHPKVGCWLGATPEVLLQVRNNQFKTMALAGTQKYAENLTWQEKEKEEQQIVTDYITTNLKSQQISFSVGQPYTIKAGSLAHIRTDINGRLELSSENKNIQSLISLLHPTPAVCGFPAKEAKKFIIDNEAYNRTFYTGFLGELNIETKRKSNRRNTENHAYRFTTKSSSLYVNLRCMELKDKVVSIYVGGGVTASSDPEKEYFETCNKTKTMKKLIF